MPTSFKSDPAINPDYDRMLKKPAANTTQGINEEDLALEISFKNALKYFLNPGKAC